VEDDDLDTDKLPESFILGKLKFRKVSIFGLTSNDHINTDKLDCYLVVSCGDFFVRTNSKRYLGKRLIWSDLNNFANCDSSLVMSSHLSVDLWDSNNVLGKLFGCKIPLSTYISHLGTDAEITLSLETESGQDCGKISIISRLTLVKKLELNVGSRVKAKYHGGKGKWHLGVISADNGDATFEVDYDDGDSESNLHEDFIQLFDLESSTIKKSNSFDSLSSVQSVFKLESLNASPASASASASQLSPKARRVAAFADTNDVENFSIEPEPNQSPKQIEQELVLEDAGEEAF
jgi:hypothetical protein